MKTPLLVLIMFLLGIQPVLADDITIIANSSVKKDFLSKKEIADIFTGKIVNWPDRQRIQFVLNGEETLHYNFIKEYLKRNPSQFKNYWKNMVFTGKGDIPKSFETDDEVIKFVQQTEGAISYIHSSTTTENVKMISVK